MVDFLLNERRETLAPNLIQKFVAFPGETLEKLT